MSAGPGALSPSPAVERLSTRDQGTGSAETKGERRSSIVLGIPLLLAMLGFPVYAAFAIRATQHVSFFAVWAYASGIVFAFNVWDWLAIDWFLFCAITPRWIVIPGTEGHPAYQDYFFHFKGFLIGTVFSGAIGLLAATMVALIALAGVPLE